MSKETKINKLENEIVDARNNLTTDRLDMSFGEIISMYEREEIFINPEFQRLYRWNNEQKTKFIESILLGIPIPPIFVAEDSQGRWELVDGLQRLSTVLSFFGILKSNDKKIQQKNNWSMQEGGIVKSFNGLKCKDLPLRFQLNIKRYACRVEVVKWDSEYDMRFELFNRLNTGGSPLTPQEIRNCIFRGISDNFNIYLKENADFVGFIKLIDPTEKQVEELYLQELVLRFTSLVKDWENVRENISTHMTNFMRDALKASDFNYNYYQTLFRDVIKLISPIGKNVFRAKNGVFSASLFDAVMIGTSQNISKYQEKDINYLTKKINKLKEDPEFRKYAGSAASSKTRVIKRLSAAIEVFESE